MARHYLNSAGVARINSMSDALQTAQRIFPELVNKDNRIVGNVMAWVPAGGIPAATGTDYNTPGKATCDIYGLDDDTGTYARIQLNGSPWSEEVYNSNANPVAGSQFVQCKILKPYHFFVDVVNCPPETP